jgi:hypothetical protein
MASDLSFAGKGHDWLDGRSMEIFATQFVRRSGKELKDMGPFRDARQDHHTGWWVTLVTPAAQAATESIVIRD